MHKDEHLTTREAAALLDVDVATVNRWAVEGRLTPIRRFDWKTAPNEFRRDEVEALVRELDAARSA